MEFACQSVSDLFLSKGGLDQVMGLGGEKLSLYVPSEAIIEPISPAEEFPDESSLTIVTHQVAEEEAPDTANATQLDNSSADLSVSDEIIATNGLLLDLNPSESMGCSDLEEATGTSTIVQAQSLESTNVKGSTECSTSTSTANKDAGTSKKDTSTRKFIPPKKDRLEPLKIDMSRPPIIPLTSSQLSLQCLECHIIFSDDRSKQRHIKMNHPSQYEQFALGDSLFTCYICSEYFSCSTELMAHQRTHTEKHPFKCPICEEAFSRSTELTTHTKVHFSKQQGGYSCSDCDRIFKSFSLLRYHQRKHTGEKPYVCVYKQCAKRFSISKTLYKHLEAHAIQKTEGPVSYAKKKKGKKCPHCNETLKTAKSLLLHTKAKHATGESTCSFNSTEAPEVLQESLTDTQIELVEPPVLCLEPAGQMAQQISQVEVDQIKKLIEQFGNVRKVNQLVIYGVDQFPAQTPGEQQSRGLLQPLHFNFTEPTQTNDVQQTGDDPIYEGTVSTVTEQVITVESIEADVVGEKYETLILEEAAMVSSEYQEKQVQTVKPDLTEKHSDEIHEVHSEVLPEVIDKTSKELLESTQEQDVIVVHSIENDNASSLISIAEFKNRQTNENTDVSQSVETLDVANTNTKEHKENNPQDQNPKIAGPSLAPELQTGLKNMDNLDNNPVIVPLPEMLDPIPSEDVKSQIAESSLCNVHCDQEKPPLEEAPNSEAEIQQSTVTTEEQDLSGPNESRFVKRALPLKKKTSKRQTPLKDKTGLKKPQMTSAQKNNTASKASKKQETVKSRKLLVRFGPTQKKEKLSKRKLLQISKTDYIYREQHEIVPALSKKSAKQKKKIKKNEKGKKTKKSVLHKNLSLPSDSKIMKTPEQKLNGKPKKRKLENQKELLKDRKPAQETQQEETPVPKKKKHVKISATPPKKKTKVNQAKSKAKKKSHILQKQTEKDQNLSMPSSMVQIKQEALLLLKGHKQPQLKVHKLDAKTTGLCQTKEVTNQSTTVVPAMKGTQNKFSKTSQTKGKSIGKKAKMVQNETPELQITPVDDLTSKSLGEKQKIVRKRKACTKIDQEIALSPPYSRVTIGCHDCGKHFSEVSALQEHMASIHSERGVLQSSMAYDVSHNLSFGSNDTIPVNAVQSRRFETQVSSDWDVDSEMRDIGLDGRSEQRLSFPALSPSPSFPLMTNPVEQTKENDPIYQETSPEHSEMLVENARENFHLVQMSSIEAPTCHNEIVSKNTRDHEDTEIQSVSELQENTDVKDELPLDVNLVTVEDPNEFASHVSTQVNDSHEASDQQEDEPNCSKVDHTPAPNQSRAKTVNSASTQYSDSHILEQPNLKQEVAEIVVQKVRNQGVARGRRGRGRGRGKRQPAENRVMNKMVANDEDCRVVYELYSLAENPDIRTPYINNKRKINYAIAASEPQALEESDSSEIQKPGEEDENIVTCRSSRLEESSVYHQTEIMRKKDNQHPANKEANLDDTSADVKPEASPFVSTPHDSQHPERSVPQGVRVILVKAEDHHILDDGVFQDNEHLQMSNLETSLDHPTSISPSGASPVPQPVSKQCIFYPVKEEQGEILVQPPLVEQRISAGLEDYEETRVGCAPMEMHPNVCSSSVEEQQSTQDFLDFLSQTSDTEDCDHFPSEPEAEALIMSCYFGIHNNGKAQQQEKSDLECRSKNSNNVGSSQSDHQGAGSTEPSKPIEYFVQYFDWNTWKEMADYTKQVAKLPVTAKEVAQFVGIHIAMGTLKFPSVKLYWEDYTRVPLIADAMSMSRFSELLSKLRLASSKDSSIIDEHGSQMISNQTDAEDLSVSKSTACTSSQICHNQGVDNSIIPHPDPLWKVRAVIKRVQERCRVLKRNGNHGVDQYRVPFERHPTHSLDHTVMVSAAGQVMDFSLQVNDSNREEVVERMVSQGKGDNQGMVFLCKPELSTPSMLEHLLKSGIRSAGKVGGSRGQIGDEFVTSDGKLKLFRCHHGFILSAVTKEKSRSTSLVSGFERAIKAANLNRDLRSLYRTPCTNSSPGAWPQTVLWELIDLALVNSWLEYKQYPNHCLEPLSLMTFRLEVSKGLILASSIDTQDSAPPYPPSTMQSDSVTSVGVSDAFDTPLPDAATRYDGLGHWPEQLSEGEEARCRFGGCERTSRVRCLKCCVFLCISRNHNCFLKFHSHGTE